MAAGEALFRLVGAKRTLAEVRGAEVVLGTHSGADFLLNDPLAADRHARLVFDGAGFCVEDLGGATGTYLDGLEVVGRAAIAAEARLVAGVTRLSLVVDELEGAPRLTVTVEEARFHFKVRDVEHFRSDPDEWVRSEVRFGRSVWVAGLTAGACLLGLLATAFVLASGPGERFLMPGPLDGSHAALFARGELACAACHTRMGGESVGVAGCAQCHGEMLAARHPFHATPVDATHGSLGEGACTLCHSGHGGRDVAAALAFARARADRTDCTACHLQGAPQAGTRVAAAPEPVPRPYGFDPFSHAAHLSAMPGLDCGVCHVREGGSERFAPVSHRTCLACHDGSNADAELGRRLQAAGRIWNPTWHGGGGQQHDAGCLACHAGPYTAQLASVPVSRPVQVLAEWIPRDHAAHFDARRCGACHLIPVGSAADGARRTSAFDHASHLPPEVLMAASGEAFGAGCLGCHADLARSSELPPNRALPPTQSCTPCHVDSVGKGTLLGFVEQGERTARERVPFSHAAHAGIAGSCAACHMLEAPDTGVGLRARTRPEAQACVSCHAGHRRIGGDSCQGCHPPADPATQDLFAGRRPERLGAGIAFPHFTPGHAGLLEDAASCFACHPRSALESSQRVEHLPLAEGVLDACRACHAREGRPFHWF